LRKIQNVIPSLNCVGFGSGFHWQQDREQDGEGILLYIVLGIVGAVDDGFSTPSARRA
jgi:hypothetical protein